jgi:hypothetical protein
MEGYLRWRRLTLIALGLGAVGLLAFVAFNLGLR